MRAGFFEKLYTARYIEDAPEPQITAPNEVKIRVKYAGVCGSDMSGYRGKHRFRIPPIISGHEFSGEVVEIGPSASGVKVGERVTADSNHGCGECFLCKQNRYNVCPNCVNLGARGWSGSFGEYVVVPDYSVVKLPDQLSFEEGALIEPIAVGMHAARLTRVQPGEKVLVIGAGPVGIGACLSVKAMGAKQIIAADIEDFNLEKAAFLGATETVNSAKADLVEQVAKLTDSVGVDVAFIACGSSAVAEQALRCARFGGRVVQIGVIKNGEPFMYDILLQKELVYAASERYVKDDYDAVVQAINSQLITVKGMITDIYPIEAFQHVIETLDKRSKPYLKVLFKF